MATNNLSLLRKGRPFIMRGAHIVLLCMRHSRTLGVDRITWVAEIKTPQRRMGFTRAT